MSKTKDIESLIEGLSPEDIKALMKEIKKPRVRKIDTSYAERRMAITNLYFSAEPKPHMVDYDRWEEYTDHQDAIRDQVRYEVVQ
tara:strand:+ start:29 stop:283 length:255 start_codon:yes stop_codon:yes gene_type:complete